MTHLEGMGGYRRCQPLMAQVQVQVQVQVLGLTKHHHESPLRAMLIRT